jgi:hypothetical protein
MRGRKPTAASIAILAVLIPLSGCTGLDGLGGCGEGYAEMHNGDYVEALIDVDAQGVLTVQFQALGSGFGFLEESEEYQTDPDIYVSLSVEHSNGSTTQVGFNTNGWDNYGDAAGGSSWGSLVTFTSPEGFCDDGCERLNFSGSMEYGVIYYDGTCDSSPWLNIPA